MEKNSEPRKYKNSFLNWIEYRLPIISYLEKDQPFECSGSYRYESLGADLFSSVLGSEFAIQGLAISPLLKAFKDLGLDIKY